MVRFKVPKNLVSARKKNKEVMQAYHGGRVTKRVNPETFYLLNKLLLNQFIIMTNENISTSELALKQKTRNFANEMGTENFQVPERWLEKWKKRYICC